MTTSPNVPGMHRYLRFVFRLFTALAVVVTLGVASPAHGDEIAPATPAFRPAPVVALGDSFMAGIGAGRYSVSDGCRRSDRSFANRFARKRGATLIDLSCPGGTLSQVAQSIDQIPRNSGVVLIQVGGNDIGFVNLAGSCLIASHATCQSAIRAARAQLPGFVTRLRAQIKRIRSAAPDADIVVLGYPRLIHSPLQCAHLLTGDRTQLMTAIQRDLDRALWRGTPSTAEFIDWPRSVDQRSLCAQDPWYALPGEQIDDLLHPTARATSAMARHLINRLGN